MKRLLLLAAILISFSARAQKIDSLQFGILESTVQEIAEHNAAIMGHFPEFALKSIDTASTYYQFNYTGNGEDVFIEYDWNLKGNGIVKMQVFATAPTMVKIYNRVFGSNRDENYFITKDRRFTKVVSASGDYYVTAASSGTRKGYWLFFVK